ncbi:hypothetical protein BDF19DRAFT_432931 [Syncephalis fuscata]|nr:hypothetical protein BDF19DRAFT_432931 [Syncephalis fuscata]
MSLGTPSGILWQNHDVLLCLCCFMEDKELMAFANSCRFIHQAIVDRPNYWERQYKQEFPLGDQREQKWLTWYNWYITMTTKSKNSTSNTNQTKQGHLLPSTITAYGNSNDEYRLPVNDLLSASNFSTTRWFYTYYRRRQTNHNFMAGRFKEQICHLPVNKSAPLELTAINPWNALILDKQESEIWSIQHDDFNKKSEQNSKELAWKKLTIPLRARPFNSGVRINSVYGANRFVVAYVDIITYDTELRVTAGSPIAEMKALHIGENESKNPTALDGHSNILRSNGSTKKRIAQVQEAIVAWSNTDDSVSDIIYLEDQNDDEQESCIDRFFDIYNDWVLLRTTYENHPYRAFDLFDLEGSKWIKGPKMQMPGSDACIQFASHNQCQLLTWSIMPSPMEDGNTPTTEAVQTLHATGRDNESLNLQWEAFDFQKDQHRCEKILSGQVSIPYCPNAVIRADMYTEKMCLITVWNEKKKFTRNDKTFGCLLSLFALGKSAPNDSAQSLFDARDYGPLLPIDSSDQGRILWSRPILSRGITNLYSEKLITVQNYRSVDVLDARNGNLLRSITCPYYVVFNPFLGSFCAMLGGESGESWLVDAHTGRIYSLMSHLIHRKTEDGKEDKPLDLSEITLSEPSRQKTRIPFACRLSNVAIGWIDKQGGSLYESYMF